MSAHAHGSKDCREMFARLSEYIDEELSPDWCARLEGHLDGCPPCQAFLESLRRTVKLVEDHDRPTLPDEIRRSLRESYRRLRGST